MGRPCSSCDFGYNLRTGDSNGSVVGLYCCHKLARVTLLGETFPLLASVMRENGYACGPRGVLWVRTLEDGVVQEATPRARGKPKVVHPSMKPRKVYSV